MKTKPKKHKAKGQWIGILFFALIGAACGLLIMLYLDRAKDAGVPAGQLILSAAVLFLSMYAAITVQIILHEAGHLLFGLLTGYRFCSFRVFSLMWVREDGRIRFKRQSIAGTGGQCLMAPPDLSDGRMPFLLYNLGGVLVNLLSAAVFLGAALLCPAPSLGRTVLMLLALVGLAFALMNGLPLRMGPVNNDGRNALELSRSPEAVRAFRIQMLIAELQTKGVRPKDMPEEWFAVPSDEAMKNGIVASVGVFCCGRLMDEHRFAEADRLMKHMLSIESGIVGLYRSLLICDRTYVELITENRLAVLQSMRTPAQQKTLKAMKAYPSVLRTEYAYALLADRDPKKAEEIRAQFEKSAASSPYPGDILSERELMDVADQKAGTAGIS